MKCKQFTLICILFSCSIFGKIINIYLLTSINKTNLVNKVSVNLVGFVYLVLEVPMYKGLKA